MRIDAHGVFADPCAQASQQGQTVAGAHWLDKKITSNAIEVYISRLLGKLEPHGIVLRSIRGFGYRLELTPNPVALFGAGLPLQS